MKSLTNIISSLSLFLFLLTPSVSEVFAQNSEVNVRNEVRQENRLEVKTEIQERNSERKASQEAKLSEAKKLRIRNQWRKLNLRLQSSIDRLMILVQRIDNRLSKFEEENPEVFTDLLHADLDEATGLLIETQMVLDEADGEIEALITSEDPKTSYAKFKETISEIKSNLKEVHLLLVKTIGNIKGLRIGSDPEVTVTSTP